MSPRIWIGLGNPGEEYKTTYHNAGKLFIEYLCEKDGVALQTPSRKHFSYAKSSYGILATPLTFMNTSGQAITEILAFFEANPKNIVIVHDESDLTIGTYKYALGGGSAGHHGLDSVIEVLGGPEFHRLRIGVRNTEEEVRQKAGDFVLGHITNANFTTLHGVFNEAITNIIEKETP